MNKPITDIQTQFDDFFTLNAYGSLRSMINPYNILYFLEHASEGMKKSYLHLTKEHLKNGWNMKPDYWIKEIAKNNTLVCQRIEELVNKGATIEGSEHNILRYNSISLLETCIKLGLDINKKNKNNYLLRMAGVKNNIKIFKFLLQQKGICVDDLDMDKKSLIYNITTRHHIHLMRILLDAYPNELYNIEKHDMTSLEGLIEAYKKEVSNPKLKREDKEYLRDSLISLMSYICEYGTQDLMNRVSCYLTLESNPSKELIDMWETINLKQHLNKNLVISQEKNTSYKI